MHAQLASLLTDLLDLMYKHADTLGSPTYETLLQGLGSMVGPTVGLWLDQRADDDETAIVAASVTLTLVRGFVHALQSGEIDAAAGLATNYMWARRAHSSGEDGHAHAAN